MVFNCTGNRAGSNAEDPIKQRNSGTRSNICHSEKPQFFTGYRDLKGSAHRAWMGSRQRGFCKTMNSKKVSNTTGGLSIK